MTLTFDDLPGLRPALRDVLSRPAPPARGGLPGLGAPSAYAFTPDPRLRARRVADTAALMARENPAGAQALGEADVFGALDEAMGANGLSVNDLADVLGSYLGQLWELANGAARDASAARLGALARQARAVLDANMTDAQRGEPRALQTLADALSVQNFVYGVTAFRLTQDWRDRTQELAGHYDQLGQDLLGLKLRLFTCDENGLVTRTPDAYAAG